MLEVGKATSSGQSIDLMILCSSFCPAWCAKESWSQQIPAQESLLCATRPNYTLSDVSLRVWSLPWQEYLHHRKWQMLQISASFLRASYWTFTSISLVTGDQVSISEIWVLRKRKQPCSSFFVEETALHFAQIGIYCSMKRILCISYSAFKFSVSNLFSWKKTSSLSAGALNPMHICILKDFTSSTNPSLSAGIFHHIPIPKCHPPLPFDFLRRPFLSSTLSFPSEPSLFKCA